MPSPAAAVFGPATRLPLRVGVGVGIAAGCVLALQVLLDAHLQRGALLPLQLPDDLARAARGGRGLDRGLRPPAVVRGRPRAPADAVGAVFAVLLAVVPLALVRVRFGTGEQLTTPFILRLVLVSVLTTVVFGAGGLVVALAVRGYTAQIGRLYAMDLAGAAAGAVVVVPLLWTVAAPVAARRPGPGRGPGRAALRRAVGLGRRASGSRGRRARGRRPGGRGRRGDRRLPPAPDDRRRRRRRPAQRQVEPAEPRRRLRPAARRRVRARLLRPRLRAGAGRAAGRPDPAAEAAAPRAPVARRTCWAAATGPWSSAAAAAATSSTR